MSDAGCAYSFIAVMTVTGLLGVVVDIARTLKHNKNLSKGDTHAHRR